MTYTEKVHVTLGVLAALASALALWHTLRPKSRAGVVWPILVFLIGFIMFVPVETQARTYLQVGWWKTLLSLWPERPAHWADNWLLTLGTWHVVQHKTGSLMVMIVGVVEWQQVRGRLTNARWRFVLPVLLIAIGLAFGVHGGTAVHLPYHTEELHHRIYGIAFVLAGVIQMLVAAGRLKPAWRGAWALLVMLVGFDLALFYRLDPRDLQSAASHHSSAAPLQK